MKQYAALLLLAMTALACTRSPRGWTLVWTEDFDGPTLQETNWTRVEHGQSDWNDMMSLRSDLVRIEDGQLVLLGKVNDGTGKDPTAFVTGGIHSKGKKSFRMARTEIRAKFSSAQGFWPALWLMPDAEVPEPVYAELDIMEHLNHEDSVYQTVHSHYSLHVDGDNPPHYGMGAIDGMTGMSTPWRSTATASACIPMISRPLPILAWKGRITSSPGLIIRST